MLARLLVFIGIPMTLLPLVFRYAVLNATSMAEHQGFAPNVDQYAHQSSPYLLTAVSVGLVVGIIPLTVGIFLLIKERLKK